jgi:hypothetical protein
MDHGPGGIRLGQRAQQHYHVVVGAVRSTPRGAFRKTGQGKPPISIVLLVSGLIHAHLKVLKNFFGLEVFIDIKSVQSPTDQLKYLRCQAYLHLPTDFVTLTVYQPERLYPELSVQAHGALIIRPEWLQELSNNDKALFTKALRVHPMSFSPKISSLQKTRRRGTDGYRDVDTSTSEQESKAMKEMEWPQRIQVMKMEYTSHSSHTDQHKEHEY